LKEPNVEIDFLRHYGLDKTVTDLLRDHYGADLLPVQETAFVENNLFDGTNMVVSAPTSSGKTLIGEVAALHHIEHDRRALVLVPTKALAYEKYEHFQRLYQQPLGIRVVLSSRDHRERDEDIGTGKYQIAVVVFEKLLGLLARYPALLESVGVAVVDELQTIFDPERGARIEQLVTHLKRAKSVQLVGLSAVLDGARLAEWLSAKLVEETQRPVELRQGVLCRGRFYYREYNSGEEGVEELFSSDSDNEAESLLEAAMHLAERGEQTLIFVPQRHLCILWADLLAQQVSLPAASEALQQLQTLETNSVGSRLQDFLHKGIAIHNSDLTWMQRELVEKALQCGEVRIAVATSTLSEGVNLPVVNTLLCRQSYQTTVPSMLRGQPPQLGRLTREQFQNMTGRSGRMGRCLFGRGMIAVGFEGEVRGVLARYLRDPWARPQPILSQVSLESTALGLLATRVASSKEELVGFIANTLSGHETGADWAESGMNSSVSTLMRSGLCIEAQNRLTCSATGMLIAQSGLEPVTGLWFLDWLDNEPETGYEETDLLMLAALCPLDNRAFFPFTEREWKGHFFVRRLWERLDQEGERSHGLLESLLGGEETLPTFDTARSIKRAAFLIDWCSDQATEDIEHRYGVMEGMAQRIGEECSWLLQGLADLARLKSATDQTIRAAAELVLRSKLGLSKEWKDFGKLNATGLSRDMVRRLVSEGLTHPSELRTIPAEQMAQWIPASVVSRIQDYLRSNSLAAKGQDNQ